jgi:hypothetical protein
MFEDETWPIIGGREDLGVPKLYADISPYKILTNGSLRCEVSLWGHLLFGLELSSPKAQNRIVRLAANKMNATYKCHRSQNIPAGLIIIIQAIFNPKIYKQ